MERSVWKSRPWLTPLLVVLMLCAMGLEIAVSVHGESVSWDEGDHLFSGLMSLRTHDFGLNPEHPPMAKMIAALPLMPLQLTVPPLGDRFFKTEAYMDGRELIFRNAPQYGGHYTGPQIIFRARMAMLVFPLLLALVVFFTAREMFGTGAGLLAMLLAVTEPNILAHGPMVTTDTAASAAFLLTIFCFYRYCKQPTWTRLVLTGVSGGLALAAKHSTFFLLPMLVVLIAIEIGMHWRGHHRPSVPDRHSRPTALDAPGRRGYVVTSFVPFQRTRSRVLQLTGGLAAIIVVAVCVLWCFYGWRFNARPAGLALNPSLAVTCSQIRPLEGRILMGIAHLHLLPESYLYGLADIRNVGNTWPSYLFGRVYAHGVWPYFPVSLLIKSTLPELIFLAFAIFALVVGRMRRSREVAFLAVPMVIYLFAGMGSGLNIGMRHVLPLYPFAIVLAAGGTFALLRTARDPRSARNWRYAIALLCGWQAATSLHAFPTYMAYSNEAFGGPKNTYKYLTDSSVDWGQQLLAVKQYVDANHIHDCWFAYFVDPFILSKDYGIPCKTLPTWDNMSSDEVNPVPSVIEGTVFVSHGSLTGYEYRSAVLNPLAPFVPLKPIAQIQDGVFVYRGRFAVPMLSSMSHLALSRIALKNKDLAGAVREGEEAVGLAPEGVEQQEALGDALHASGREDEARRHYQAALDRVVHDMEPSARAVWEPRLREKMAGRESAK